MRIYTSTHTVNVDYNLEPTTPTGHTHGVLATGKAWAKSHYHKDGHVPHSHLEKKKL